jgi:hypothetical protein
MCLRARARMMLMSVRNGLSPDFAAAFFFPAFFAVLAPDLAAVFFVTFFFAVFFAIGVSCVIELTMQAFQPG